MPADDASIISQHGFSTRERPSPIADPKAALHAAERDFETQSRGTPGVTRADVDTDLMRLGLIATGCAELTRKSWREYRAMNETGDTRETMTVDIARQVADVFASQFGMSREAATVLDELIKSEFA